MFILASTKSVSMPPVAIRIKLKCMNVCGVLYKVGYEKGAERMMSLIKKV